MTGSTANRRKILVPLASLLAAGAIAVGSGATFTSQSQNPGNSYEAGTLTQSNSRSGQSIFDLKNIKPGDTVRGYVTVTNTGSLAADFEVTETVVENTFAEKSLLRMTVTDVTDAGDPVVVANDVQFGALGTRTLGAWAPDEARSFTFAVTLDQSAGNGNQGKKADATYTWNSTQELTVSTTDQNYPNP